MDDTRISGLTRDLPVFRRILVPLDGSTLAEQAVAPAVDVAQRSGGSVILLHVIEADAPGQVHGEQHLGTVEEATSYLQRVAAAAQRDGVVIETHVHSDPQRDLPASLNQHIEEEGADLVVMSPHGTGGLRGFFFGRMAANIVKFGSAPVLVAQGTGGQWTPPQTIALLHDPVGEWLAAVAPTLALARLYGARVHLIHAVPTSGTLQPDQVPAATLLPGATRAVLELAGEQAQEELRNAAAALGQGGPTVTYAVVRGDPGAVTVEEAGRAGAAMLSLATHGRHGLSGVWSGSVGAKVLRRFNQPLLLVRSAD